MNLPVTWIGLILVCLVTTNLAVESAGDENATKKDEKISNETSTIELSSNHTLPEETLKRNETAIEVEASGNATELARESRKIVTTPLGKNIHTRKGNP